MLNVLKILFCLDHKAPPRPSIATDYPLNIRIPSQCVTELSCYIKSLDEFSQIFCCYSSSWLFSRFLKVTRLSRASHVQSYDMHIPYRAILASSVVFLIHTKSSRVGWYNTHMRHTLHTLMMISKNKILHFPFFDKLLFFCCASKSQLFSLSAFSAYLDFPLILFCGWIFICELWLKLFHFRPWFYNYMYIGKMWLNLPL